MCGIMVLDSGMLALYETLTISMGYLRVRIVVTVIFLYCQKLDYL